MHPIDTPLTRSWTSSFMPGAARRSIFGLHRLDQVEALRAGLRLEEHDLVDALAALVEGERGADALVVAHLGDRVAQLLRVEPDLLDRLLEDERAVVVRDAVHVGREVELL